MQPWYGNMDKHLRFLGGLILTHTHLLPGQAEWNLDRSLTSQFWGYGFGFAKEEQLTDRQDCSEKSPTLLCKKTAK